MKRHIIPFTFILLLIFLCENCADKGVIEKIQTVNIIGNHITAFAGKTSSRSTSISALPISSQISFHSKGGINASGIRLIWTGEHWEPSQSLTWNNNQPIAEIKAYHPAETVENQQFYNETGELTDLLCATQTCQQGSITLSFQHLFSKVTFRISQSFNRQIQQIVIIPSHLVSSLNCMEASIGLEENYRKLSVKKDVNPSGEYSLIVPSSQKMTLSVKITTTTREYTIELPEQLYTSGTEYIHTINNQQQGLGISSVEDYIAFSHLINGYEYPGRSLDEFGETIDGETIYYLLKDLEFTEETSGQVMEIGYKSSSKGVAFNNTFEGNHHTIKGLNLTGKSNQKYFGIFGYLGATGKIKNLSVENLFIKITDSQSNQIGGLVGYSSGIIDNCSFQNITATCQDSEELTYIGGICYLNLGEIKNCRIISFTVSSKFYQSGGISFIDQGKVTNCHVSAFKHTSKKISPSICYVTKNSKFSNILCSQITGNKIINSCTTQPSVEHCYYPSTIDLPIDKSYTNKFIPYDEDTYLEANGTNVEIALNQWVLLNEQPLQSWIRNEDQTVTVNIYGY